jgi:hypothetical protein
VGHDIGGGCGVCLRILDESRVIEQASLVVTERGRPRPQDRQRLERRHYVLAGQVEPLLQQLIKLVTHG